MDGETLLAQDPEKYYPRFLEKNIRPDGRKLKEARSPVGRFDVITRSDGSASVSLGSTMVICATRGEIGIPEEGFDGKGRLTVNVTVAPGCGIHVRDGDSITFDLAQRLQKLLEDPKVLDTSTLLIRAKEAYWEVKLDLVLVSLDGNSLDASMLCALLALRHTTLPALDEDKKAEFNGESSRYVLSSASNPDITARRIILQHLPITVSMGCINSHWIVDPNLQEEGILDTQATITCIGGHLNFDLRGQCQGTDLLTDDRSLLLEYSSNVSKQWAQWLETF